MTPFPWWLGIMVETKHGRKDAVPWLYDIGLLGGIMLHYDLADLYCAREQAWAIKKGLA